VGVSLELPKYGIENGSVEGSHGGSNKDAATIDVNTPLASLLDLSDYYPSKGPKGHSRPPKRSAFPNIVTGLKFDLAN